MRIPFGTKSETLERLAPVLTTARILPLYRFGVADWVNGRSEVVSELRKDGWFSRPIIVRSSAHQEDGATASHAGRFATVSNVRGEEATTGAIEAVLRSYGAPVNADQIFIQPFLGGIALRGVAFGLEPDTGGPYLVVNYEWSEQAGAVTSGVSTADHTYYWFKGGPPPTPPQLAAVARLMKELEELTGTESLDVEFAWTEGQLYLFQVRPLVRPSGTVYCRAAVARELEAISARIHERERRFSSVLGSGVALGVMPDWNPAEMIGLRPRPLAASLYRECITNRVWCEQRRDYGYRDVVGVPLMVCLGGQPFIDVRASFTSFVPAALNDDLARQLVEHYLARLRAQPELHDKIEMDLVLHCWTFDLPERLRDLAGVFPVSARNQIAESLRALTIRVLDDEDPLWRKDSARLARFGAWLDSQSQFVPAGFAELGTFLSECIEGGSRPFVGLARTGFIATCLLRSLVRVGFWGEEDEGRFLRSLRTVVSRMWSDRRHMSVASFLRLYGHLRPGTYDILVPRYDEAPDRYLADGCAVDAGEPGPFKMSGGQRKALAELLRGQGLRPDPEKFLRFVGEAIEAREYGKFVYSRGVSEFLRHLADVANRTGFSREDCSYADVAALRESFAATEGARRFADSVAAGRVANHDGGVSLPPLLLAAEDIWAFHQPRFQANFVTRGAIEGPAGSVESLGGRFANSVLLLPCADPGYDWIFTHGIAAFVTMYGGANSHMAIRARELNVPAAIGVGEPLFRRLSGATVVRVDCLNKRVVAVQ